MKNFKLYTAVVALAMCSMSASAQSLRSGYFLEGYTFRHEINPAFGLDKNYVSLPALGNLNIGTTGNVGLGSFLFPYGPNGKLTTFMNGSIGADQFLGNLKDNNRINANINLTLLSAGFKAWGGYNTLSIGVRSRTNMNLPYELFEFMKLGQTSANTVYNINDLGINSQTYAEIALGHSRQLTDKLRVGAKMKFLLGGAYADVKVDQLSVAMGEEKWLVQANGEMNAALKGLIMPTKKESGKEITAASQEDLLDWDGIDVDGPGLSGFGMAFDFGASYKLMDNLTLSASLNDLGFIKFSNNIKARTANKAWEFDGFHDIAVDSELGDDDPMSLNSQLDKIGDDLEDFASFHRESVGGKVGSALAATLNVGAEYEMPFYRKLSVGFLSTTAVRGKYTWSEGRLSANVAPTKWFEAGVNGAVSSFGSSWGWIVNFHPKGFNFFLGMDQVVGKVSKQFIPINNMNMNVSLGMNVAF